MHDAQSNSEQGLYLCILTGEPLFASYHAVRQEAVETEATLCFYKSIALPGFGLEAMRAYAKKDPRQSHHKVYFPPQDYLRFLPVDGFEEKGLAAYLSLFDPALAFPKHNSNSMHADNGAELAELVLAGGCFWCLEAAFDQEPGVLAVKSGYCGGAADTAEYSQVKKGNTGHYEVLKLIYDRRCITYRQLCDKFWRHIDPTDGGGQFIDRGSQYRTAIFYANSEEQQEAEASKAELVRQGVYGSAPICTDIIALGEFYPAEQEHQAFYQREPQRFKDEEELSGRNAYFAQQPLSS